MAPVDKGIIMLLACKMESVPNISQRNLERRHLSMKRATHSIDVLMTAGSIMSEVISWTTVM
jgi:hypothetical protein